MVFKKKHWTHLTLSEEVLQLFLVTLTRYGQVCLVSSASKMATEKAGIIIIISISFWLSKYVHEIISTAPSSFTASGSVLHPGPDHCLGWDHKIPCKIPHKILQDLTRFCSKILQTARAFKILVRSWQMMIQISLRSRGISPRSYQDSCQNLAMIFY